MALTSFLQQGKAGVVAQVVDQGIANEVGITEEPAVNGQAKQA